MTDYKYTTATPYSASYIVFRQDGKIAFVLRSGTDWMNDHYGLPSGKIEKGESAIAAAIREAKEEVGVTLRAGNIKYILTGYRHEETDWVDFFFEATKWEGDLYNAEPHMHSELAWLDPNNLPDNIVPSVRFYIEQIQAGATFIEYGW